ncbi:MAG: HAD hydrolase family protein [Planctomycetota bacterium]|nr:HAD hydrolase family protein [Planctomycetota bacterium]
MTAIDYNAIKLLVLDVDGVMTDGGIILTDSGEQAKCFNVRDGAGMKYWRRAGGKLAMITGRGGQVIWRRAKELDVDAVRTEALDKLPAYLEVLKELGFAPEQTAVMGDDLPDLPLLQRCGLAIAPADAADEVRHAAAVGTQARGGRGAVREAIELIMKKTGAWDGILARYRRPAGEAPR